MARLSICRRQWVSGDDGGSAGVAPGRLGFLAVRFQLIPGRLDVRGSRGTRDRRTRTSALPSRRRIADMPGGSRVIIDAGWHKPPYVLRPACSRRHLRKGSRPPQCPLKVTTCRMSRAVAVRATSTVPPLPPNAWPSSPVEHTILDLQFAILHYANSRLPWRSSHVQIILESNKIFINQKINMKLTSQPPANPRHWTPSTRHARRQNKPKQAIGTPAARPRPAKRKPPAPPPTGSGARRQSAKPTYFPSTVRGVAPEYRRDAAALRCVIAKGGWHKGRRSPDGAGTLGGSSARILAPRRWSLGRRRAPNPRARRSWRARSPPPPPPAPAGPTRPPVRSADARHDP